MRLFNLSILIALILSSCKPKQWSGQEIMKVKDTSNKQILKQETGVIQLDNGVAVANNFNGARCNSVELDIDTINITISPENKPINDSPWYAFRIWSNKKKKVWIKLKYTDRYLHRYNPKVSLDGKNWNNIEASKIKATYAKPLNQWNQPTQIVFELLANRDIKWIAAQPLQTTEVMEEWGNQIASKSFASKKILGRTKEYRPLNVLTIGNTNHKEMVVLLGRQHPPEVTGSIAMQLFVEELCSNTDLAKAFRERYTTVLFPLMNPDGVDMGHWRHNANGVDLNRDWGNFNQSETRLVKLYMEQVTKHSKGEVVAMLDFHSTWEDIFYTLSPKLKGNYPGLYPKMIKAMKNKIEGYEPNISPRPINEPRINSMTYFFHIYNAEAMVFEIGDNTPSEEITQKAIIAAKAYMHLLLKKQ